MKKKMTKEKLVEVVKKSSSIAEALKKMEMSVSTGNYKSFHNAIKMYDIDITHFLGQSHLRGKRHNTNKTMPLNKILSENSVYTNIARLKIRLIEEKLLEYKCDICNISNWQNKQLSLQLDHINGISNDHRLENLRFLCPNCHSQTETFAGRNIKMIHIIPDKPDYDYCICGNEKLKSSKNCKKCALKNREKIEWPTQDELQTMINDIGYAGTARKLNVSSTSIRDRLNKPIS